MKVLVVGAGTMGHAIAEVVALAKHEVYLVDIKEEILKQAIANIKWSLEQLLAKGKISSIDEVLARIKTLTNLKEVAPFVDLVIEAIPENYELKKRLFEELDSICNENTILTSNTSSIPISKLAKVTKRSDKVAGLHFFNPPLLIRFVEIVGHDKVSNTTIKKLEEFASSLEMEYVVLRKDVVGFIVNRLAIRTFLEAIKLTEKGFKYEEIDALAKIRLGYPMGIFELADFVGLDIIYGVINEMIKEGLKINIPRILEELIANKRFGIKSGAGFYEYGFGIKTPKVDVKRIYEINPLNLLSTTINEAAWLIKNDVSNAYEIDKAMKKGLNLPKGPLEYADDVGIDRIVEVLEQEKRDTGSVEYEPNELLKELVSNGNLGKKTGKGFYEWQYEKIDLGNIRYEKRHDYALITMRREKRLNALDEEMWRNLNEAFNKAAQDKAIRVVLITGEGRAFSSGDDINVMSKWKSLNEGREFFERTIGPLVMNLMNYEKPIISLINGIAFGGGLEINLFFDIVIASEDASFALPEGLIGAMPPLASTLGLAMLNKKLMRYCLTGEQFSAEEARELGLVDLVVAKEQLDIVAIEFIDKIKRLAPLSVKAIKRSFNSYKSIFLNSIIIGANELASLVASEDFKEGMKAFIDKRMPIWKGQ
jgi:enoyl-CoA hydratase/3-hydroxyacyl-CoA dehydrogenase